jgi:hypothetical protein
MMVSPLTTQVLTLCNRGIRIQYAYCRCVKLGIREETWPSYLKEIIRVCKPGGWAQIGEIEGPLYDDGGTAPLDAPIWKVQLLFC